MSSGRPLSWRAAVVQGQFDVGGVRVESGEPLATAAAPGTTVDVTLPGFLPRQTTVNTPRTSGT